MPDRSSKQPGNLGEIAGKTMGRAGEKAAGAATKIGKKILSFLKKLFISKPVEYLKVAAKNLYLKIKEKGKQKAVELVSSEQVPEKYREDDGRKKAGTKLETLSLSEVARRANNHGRIRQQVLDSPDLIDARSKDEAEIKLKLAAGGTPSEAIDNSKKSVDEFFEELGKEWTALWAYNQYGDQLSDKLTQEFNNGQKPGATKKPEPGKTGPGVQPKNPRSDGIVITENASDWGISLQGNDSGKTSRSGEGYISHRTGDSLKGTGKASIDTDSGDVDITTTSSTPSSSNGDSSGTALGEASGDGLGSSSLSGSNGDSGGSNGGE